MAFDSTTRNKLAKFVAEARSLLVGEFGEQLQEIYGIRINGTVLPLENLAHLTDAERAKASLLREQIGHILSGTPGTVGKKEAEAVDRIIREQAFTLFNRFCALRMAEERDLVQECVGGGFQSKGFRVFETVAGTGIGNIYDRYKTYLFSLFDEISTELGVLFDRFSPMGLLFPRENALKTLLGLLHDSELKPLWSEDETIGWIYQYWNSKEERQMMRKASAAPRNSRELAVRNQFFTPRYVVEFLTDNTLGRIWYEMRKGDTALKKECHYLVRRPNEIFLTPGEKAPAVQENETELSQEELIKKPVHIEHRPKKDPRDLRVLDPACGSGHFLLYCFDLLERIYEEAWEDTESPESEVTGRVLREDYETIEELRQALPKLTMEHNLHGIDIDPRAVQISALALWLRAQKTWKNLGIKAVGRPRVAKSNIVTAEPMPGEKDIKEQFTASLKPRVLGQLVDVVFEKMKLAGEVGSLLKIEEDIKDAIAEARKQWLDGPKHEQHLLFTGMTDPHPRQQEVRFDSKGVTDERFWDGAEDCVLEALEAYADKVENGHAIRRQLFVEDAARGFAFIELCRKRYDVVLMNPPFGDSASASKDYLGLAFPKSKYDLFAMFVIRWLDGLNESARLGAITNKTGFFLQTFASWRRTISSGKNRLETALDLGFGVLDSAMVETMSYVLSKGAPRRFNRTIFVRLTNVSEKESVLPDFLACLRNGECPANIWLRQVSQFESIPNSPMCYWAGKEFIDLFRNYKPFAPCSGHIYQGIATGDNFRFLRCLWEVSPSAIASKKWVTYAKGGVSTLWYSDFPLVVLWANNGSEIKANAQQRYGSASRTVKNEVVFFKAGLTYTQVTVKGFFARVLPQGCVFDMKGPSVIFEGEKHVAGLGIFCSLPIRTIAKLLTDCRQWHPTNMMCVPYPIPQEKVIDELQNAVIQLIKIRRGVLSRDETSSSYGCVTPNNTSESESALVSTVDNIVADCFGSQVSDFEELDSILKAEQEDEVNDEEPTELSEVSDENRSIISRIIGFLFGRWDVRIAVDPSLAPLLRDPFDSLPVCPPSMLIGSDGLPAESSSIVSEEWLRARPDAGSLPPQGVIRNPAILDSEYPLRISWNGILVDDPGFNGGQPHLDDIVRRVRDVLDLLWKDKSHDIEQNACDNLGIADLRDYFRRPTGFFEDHLKKYSKSRRQAPIYWPLSTDSGSYTLWIYYHRLDDQILFKCIRIVELKIKEVGDDIESLMKEMGESGNKGLRGDVEKLQAFHQELVDLMNELLRVAKFYKPDLNDGVVINAAPLWKLFRLKKWQKSCKDCWDKLEAGEYDWSHMAMNLHPDQVREKCQNDKSLAIAHGLEELYVETENPKKKGKRKTRKTKDAL